jgi:magnesium chelatase subunit D
MSMHSQWSNALRLAAVLALQPAALGGAVLRCPAGVVRDTWLAALAQASGEHVSTSACIKIPSTVSEERLIGGLDLAATLAAGRPVRQPGLLAQAKGKRVLLAMAERWPVHLAALTAAAVDAAGADAPCIIALDEGVNVDEAAPQVLAERLALHIDLSAVSPHDALDAAGSGLADGIAAEVQAACTRLSVLRLSDLQVQSIAAAALALGIRSMRPVLFACRVACASAALDARTSVDDDDLLFAVQTVLAPRARQLPAAAGEQQPEQNEQQCAPPDTSDNSMDTANRQDDTSLDDRMVETALASIPPHLLALLSQQARAWQRGVARSGRAGDWQRGLRRGRPCGVKPGNPRRGTRLAVTDTLRAAALWQAVRSREKAPYTPQTSRLHIRSSDFRVQRYRARRQSTTVFVVDASGSAALHRLAEAKGAVEVLLAGCYVRRDQVALIAFRGLQAELILPPTRSLTRAKRELAALPGGGGTPLASAIGMADQLAAQIARNNDTPTLVFLTDGRANINRAGGAHREQAIADALTAATHIRKSGVRSLLVDISPRSSQHAQQLAGAMGALYWPLPHAEAGQLARVVQQAQQS